ncbi:MAG: PAS domain-containing protein [Candidatus Omnitrophica bacterium]|nr:PAS domain-containing protein [Candidatus Omnitrophota bacterium]
MDIPILDPKSYILTPYALPPLVVGVLTAALGAFVSIRERGSILSALFCLMTWTGATWLLGYVGAYSARFESVAYFWVTMQMCAVVFIPCVVYLFSLGAVQRLKEFRIWGIISCAVSVLFCLSIFLSDQFLRGLYLYPWGYVPDLGPLSYPFLVFFAAVLYTSLRLYWIEYRGSSAEQQRRRAKSFMAAFTVSYLGSVDFLSTYGIPLYPMGYLAVFGFLLMVSQIIWQYRLVAITPAFAAEHIISTMASALIVVDREGTIRVANKAAEHLFGGEKQNLIGCHIADIGSHFFSNRRLENLIRTGGPERFETFHHTPQGRLVSLDVSASPIWDRAGQPVGAICIASDISEWKRSQQLLQEAKTYAENIVNTVREPLLVLDTNLRIKTANRSFYQTFRFTPEEALNRYLYDLGPGPWNASKMRAVLEMIPNHTAFENIELDYEFPSIGRRTLLLNACRLYEEGHRSQLILLAMEDITQRKEWERQLIQQSQQILLSEEALRKQTRILQSILSSIGDGVVVSDDEGNLILFNPAAEKLLGVDARQTTPARWTARYGCYLPDKVTPYPENDLPLARAIRGEEVNEAEIFIRNVMMPEGVWLSVSARPLKDSDGVLRGGVVVFRDITERKTAEEKLKKAHWELQQSHEKLKNAQLDLIQAEKMDSVGRLAAGVAHEVKNPLAVILQGIDYLNKALPNKDANVSAVLGYTRDAVHRADSVIRGLLDFSSHRQLELREENLNAIIQESLFLVKHEIDKSRVTVIKNLQAEAANFLMDRQKIEQVFVNIFINAVQAMPEGGTLTVRTYLKENPAGQINGNGAAGGTVLSKEPDVITEVEDTGTGIPEKALPKVFDPFFTTKPTGKGTGLGLTVSKNIIQMHGGTMAIQNRPEGGTRVTLVFKPRRTIHYAEEKNPAH